MLTPRSAFNPSWMTVMCQGSDLCALIGYAGGKGELELFEPVCESLVRRKLLH